MANANPSSYKYVSGATELVTALRTLRAEVQAGIAERGVREALAPVLVAAKRYAKRSERTGALRESLVIKTVAYKNTGKAVGLVGPDKQYYKKGKKTSLVIAALYGADRPANYAHLIEYGHHVVAPIEGTSRRKNTAMPAKSGATWVPAKPFLRPAILTTIPAQQAGFERGLALGFEAAVNKATRKAAKLQ